MYDNNLYNLMNQCVQEHKSLWKIKEHYINDAQAVESESFWKKMVSDKEEHIAELTELIKQELAK